MTAIGVLNHRHNATSPGTGLSRAAIIGIALSGSIVLFLALSHLFIVLGRRRDRERFTNLQARRDLLHTPHGLTYDPDDSDLAPIKKKLRKRSLRKSDLKSLHLEGETDVNARNRSSSVPVLPPLFSRRDSYDINLFPNAAADDIPRIMERAGETLRQWEASQKLERQKGREMYQARRKSSWIDEDALHGPRVSPQKDEAKNADGTTASPWFSSYLGKKISFRRPRSEPFIFGNPTLPHREQAAGLGAEEERGRSEKRTSMPAVHDGVMLPPRNIFSNSPYKPGQYSLSHIAVSDAVSLPASPVPQIPSAKINNPRHRNSAALHATEQLAGSARVPSIMLQQQQQQQPQYPRHRATESELTDILRMTSERLQDGKRSSRRQTMTPRPTKYAGGDIYNEQYMDMMRSNSGSRNSSPAKSQRSAPAIMCAELEDTEISPTKSQCSFVNFATTQAPKHNRQNSQVSAVSDAESLLSLQGIPQSDHITTALSSPSRSLQKVNTPGGGEASQRQLQHYSPASSRSSPLSTLYSEEEGERGNTTVDSRGFVQAAGTEHQTYKSGDPDFPFEDGESPRCGTQNGRRGTVGQITFPWPQPGPRTITLEGPEVTKSWLPHETSRHSTIFAMEAPPVDDDPFVAKRRASSQDPMRLSQVFTPIPNSSVGNMEVTSRAAPSNNNNTAYPIVRVTSPTTSPTPSSKSQRTMPPPHFLRPLTDSPTLGAPRRGTSPALSEGGLSSVYGSYCGSDASVRTANHSTATLDTVPTNESRTTNARSLRMSEPTVLESQEAVADSCNISIKKPWLERPGSAGSIYSQNDDDEGDTVPPLRSSTTTGHLHHHQHNNNATEGEGGALSDAVAELRRMNSAVSAASGSSSLASAGSPTLPAMRGGGFGPGKKTGGSRNYLALGSPERAATAVSPKREKTKKSGNPRDMVAGTGICGRETLVPPPTASGGSGRRMMPRSRRGTTVRTGGAVAAAVRNLQESVDLEKGVLTEGSGGNMGTVGGSGFREQKMDRAVRKLQNLTYVPVKAGVEDLGLYDEKGFLRSSPLRRD